MAEDYIRRMPEMQVLVDNPEQQYKSCFVKDPQYGNVIASTIRVLEDEPKLLNAWKQVDAEGGHYTEQCQRLTV